MKKILVLLLAVSLVSPLTIGLAADTASAIVAADLPGPELASMPAPTPASNLATGILASLWTYVNSGPGVAVILGIVTWILGRIFIIKPQWKVVYDKYFPAIMAAVKQAEKAIPDTTPNKGLARADYALKKLIEIEPALANIPTPVVKQVIDVVHASAEANENI